MKRRGEGEKREMEGGACTSRSTHQQAHKVGREMEEGGMEKRPDPNTLEECMNSENLVKRNEYWITS